jgi:hypothetical protein
MVQDVMQVAGQLRALGQRRCSFPRRARGRLLGEQCLGMPARIQAYGRALARGGVQSPTAPRSPRTTAPVIRLQTTPWL